MKRVAILAGLAGLLAPVAHAQTPPNLGGRVQGSAAPGIAGAPAAAAAPAPACSLTTTISGRYVDTPLAGFDPAAPGPLPTPPINAALVVCNRASIVPQLTDYRVLTEMHLPLAIKDGKRTLLLGSANGKLQIGIQEGEVAPAEVEALRTRIDQMTDAMAKAVPAKK